ncbi:renin receptor-like isoform X2 [Mizuhopecten yessoensis]|uniref:Renin receptor n=1 Tax=Mizuhopecten yessoensis TaxID=6573 RepID=A0A210QKB5_MIZYE|nr:renin receptor-like isoform X2 [Mizuhopecten yessoensis]OWF49195.1 Renin receptor [Mizuhopecten yessoensis]
MATDRTLPLFLAVIFGLIIGVFSQELVVTHAPKYVHFQEQSEKLQASDVPKVISHTLGLPAEEVSWTGIKHGSLFKRPKANVLISVTGYEGIKQNPLKLKNVATYPVKSDVPSLDIVGLMNNLQNAFFDKNPLLLDAGVDNNFFDVHTDFDVFRKIPDTMRHMADRLMDSDSILQSLTTGTLNSSSPTHLKLMGELQMIQDVFSTVSDKPELLSSKSPDLLSFNIGGLQDVAEKHGAESSEAADASNLVTDFIHKITEDFRNLYKDNVVVEVLTLTPQGGYVRKARSLKATAEATGASSELNLSKDYDQDYPSVFNIILWFMIIMAIVLFAVCYGMWNMDPGRDSIIYRMTTTRLKKD